MSLDPMVMDTQSPFASVNNDPVNGVDPLGTCAGIGCFIAIADPSGTIVALSAYNEAFKLEGPPLITFLQKYDHLGTNETYVVRVESSGFTYAQNGQFFGLGQLGTVARGQYLPTDPLTQNPWLQIWAMHQYIKARYGIAANAVAHEHAHGWY